MSKEKLSTRDRIKNNYKLVKKVYPQANKDLNNKIS